MESFSVRTLLCTLAVFGVVFPCAGASAQTSTPLAYWQNNPGIVLRPLAGPPPEWNVVLGGGVGVLPAYEGSNSSRLTPSPELDIRYRDLAFVSLGEGMGVNLLRGNTYRAGIALTYDIGREHNAATRLSGTGNVDPALAPKLFVEFAILPVIVSVDLRYRATAQQGFVGDVGVYMPLSASETFQLFAGPAVTFADDGYMNAYFGVSPPHAQPHSMFRPYTAHGGIKNVNFGVSALYHFNEGWFVAVDAGVERLMDSAADSPLVQTRTAFGATAVLCYNF